MRKPKTILINIFCAIVVVTILSGFALMLAGMFVKDKADTKETSKPLDYSLAVRCVRAMKDDPSDITAMEYCRSGKYFYYKITLQNEEGTKKLFYSVSESVRPTTEGAYMVLHNQVVASSTNYPYETYATYTKQKIAEIVAAAKENP